MPPPEQSAFTYDQSIGKKTPEKIRKEKTAIVRGSELYEGPTLPLPRLLPEQENREGTTRRASSSDQGRGSDQDQDAVPISGSDNLRTLARRRSPPASRLRSQLHAGQNHGTSMTPARASGRIGQKACARLARRSTRPTATGRSEDHRSAVVRRGCQRGGPQQREQVGVGCPRSLADSRRGLGWLQLPSWAQIFLTDFLFIKNLYVFGIFLCLFYFFVFEHFKSILYYQF
jgi:hypothetical protein